MERTMSVEDKIRKAEEIYYRRRNQERPVIETIKEEVKPYIKDYMMPLLKKRYYSSFEKEKK